SGESPKTTSSASWSRHDVRPNPGRRGSLPRCESADLPLCQRPQIRGRLHATGRTRRTAAPVRFQLRARGERRRASPDDPRSHRPFGWPQAGVVARLRKHRDDIPKLSTYLQDVSEIPRLGIQVVAITQPLVEAATRLSRQHELLAGDALIVAVMQA